MKKQDEADALKEIAHQLKRFGIVKKCGIVDTIRCKELEIEIEHFHATAINFVSCGNMILHYQQQYLKNRFPKIGMAKIDEGIFHIIFTP